MLSTIHFVKIAFINSLSIVKYPFNTFINHFAIESPRPVPSVFETLNLLTRIAR